MKNLYLYGASDDCHEIDTDFDDGCESYDDIQINEVVAHFYFDGDWGIELKGEIPPTWKVRAIVANAAVGFRNGKTQGEFIHIAVPDDESIVYRELPDEDDW